MTGVRGRQGRAGLLRVRLLRGEQGQDQDRSDRQRRGCITPSNETIADGTYKPLSRPLFIYPSTQGARAARVRGVRQVLPGQRQQLRRRSRIHRGDSGCPEEVAGCTGRRCEVVSRRFSSSADPASRRTAFRAVQSESPDDRSMPAPSRSLVRTAPPAGTGDRGTAVPGGGARGPDHDWNCCRPGRPDDRVLPAGEHRRLRDGDRLVQLRSCRSAGESFRSSRERCWLP